MYLLLSSKTKRQILIGSVFATKIKTIENLGRVAPQTSRKRRKNYQKVRVGRKISWIETNENEPNKQQTKRTPLKKIAITTIKKRQKRMIII